MDIEQIVNDIPTQILTRMNSGNVSFREDFLRVQRDKKGGQYLLYNGYQLKFTAEEATIRICIEAPHKQTIDSGLLSSGLSSPKSISGSSKKLKEKYDNMLSNGRVMNVHNDKGEIIFKIKQQIKDRDEFYNAVWYKIRPALALYMKEN